MAVLETKLTLIGGPTLLIEIGGTRILTDPTFDPPGQYAGAGTLLEKKIGPAIAAEALLPIDIVTVSHDQHFDNLDHSGRTFLPKAKAVYSTRGAVERLGPYIKGLAAWESTVHETGAGNRFHITAVPARHGPAGFEPISGEVLGFLIGIEEPGDAIYIMGDTVWFEGVAEVARRFRPRLVVAFAGAAKPRGPFRVTMDDNDLIETAHAFPQARMVAIHNYGWGHFTETQADAAQTFAALRIPDRLQTLTPGQATSLLL